MSRANVIRKKALEFAKKREWDKALNQYMRLAEIESHNPNVFNELGDLHLKIGNKREAFDAFHSAIDAYSRVSLFNNAVAVCKKIIRLNSSDHIVYGKLARLRIQQGFKKEAANYAMTFLDMVAKDPTVDPDGLKSQLTELSAEMTQFPNVLKRISEYLIEWEFTEEAAAVLEKLADAYSASGMPEESRSARERMSGFRSVDTATGAGGGEGRGAPPSSGDAPSPLDGGHDYGTVELGAPSSATATEATVSAADGFPSPEAQTATVAPEPPPAADRPVSDEPMDAPLDEPVSEAPSADEGDPARDSSPEIVGEGEVWVPAEDLPDALKKGDGSAAGEVVNISDIVDQFNAEVKADIDIEDYRSHYDLGMAYLEMDLLPEAVREFQFASHSSLYEVRCLEMIGLCFLKQNQPRLAIKQLEKGLSLVREDDRESLGLRYNLGLAFEMTADLESAKRSFEDVYVVDVAFRDVAEKIKKYTS